MRSLADLAFDLPPAARITLSALALAACAPVALSQTTTTPAARTLAPVEVRAGGATAASQSASVGGLSEAPLAETPQSVSVIRSESLRDAGASSLSSAIRSEPSAADFYNTLGYVESLQIRGFQLDKIGRAHV